jgi:hypothetical protein
MKKLFRFYCSPCDHAWHDLLEVIDNIVDYCDYCSRECKAENINEENN